MFLSLAHAKYQECGETPVDVSPAEELLSKDEVRDDVDGEEDDVEGEEKGQQQKSTPGWEEPFLKTIWNVFFLKISYF